MVVDAERNPQERAIPDPAGNMAHLGFGTDWGALASAWLTEWERSRDPKLNAERYSAKMKFDIIEHGSGGASAALFFAIRSSETRVQAVAVRGNKMRRTIPRRRIVGERS